MAGGIDWFRWHHGSVTDPKFQLAARKASVRLSDVIAVWAFILEKASASEKRGSFGEIDFESVDCLFGLEDGKTQAIIEQMSGRGLVSDGFVCSWEKRQPKREDDTAAERKRRQREREHELQLLTTSSDEESRNVTQHHTDVTQCHTDVTQCHDREEESREDICKEANASSSASRPDPVPPCPIDELIDSYESRLPMLPVVRRSLFKEGKNVKSMRQRWKWVMTTRYEKGERKGQPLAGSREEGIEWFDRFFTYVSESDFLTGKSGDWMPSLAWLMTASNFEKVLSNQYHKVAA